MVVNVSFMKWYILLDLKQNTLFAIFFSMLCYAIYKLIK